MECINSCFNKLFNRMKVDKKEAPTPTPDLTDHKIASGSHPMPVSQTPTPTPDLTDHKIASGSHPMPVSQTPTPTADLTVHKIANVSHPIPVSQTSTPTQDLADHKIANVSHPIPVSQTPTPTPGLTDHKIISVSVDVVETRNNLPSLDKSKMSLYRGSFRESFRSPRESVQIPMAISTREENLDATTTTLNYPPLFDKTRKMDLYRSLVQENKRRKLDSEHSVVCTSQNDHCLLCRDFSAVDIHAGNYPRQYVTSIPDLAFQLCNPFEAKVDKARSIFTWLHHNIAYDTESYFQNKVRHQSPEETLRSGLSVCQGYAELFQKLARHGGLEAIVISGHGKGYGYQSGSNADLKNHAWNAVKLDYGQWQLVDPCWGAGGVDENRNFNKKFKPTAFTSSPETFRLKHFPSDPKYQFCKSEISWEEYIGMKDTPMLYEEFFAKEFSEVTIEPSCRIIKPARTKFVITSKCPHTFIRPEHQYVLLLCIDGTRTPFQVDSNGTTWMCESSALRENSTVVVGLLEKFGDRDGRGVTVDEFLDNKTKGYSWCYISSWDVKR